MGEDEWQAAHHIMAKRTSYHGVGWHWMAWQGGHEQGVGIRVAELEIDQVYYSSTALLA
jgi:hypothetical protein